MALWEILSKKFQMIESNFRVDKLANLNGYYIQEVREALTVNPMNKENDKVDKEKRREEVQREMSRSHKNEHSPCL